MSFETYKGIEFIRISALPEEERVLIRKTLDDTKIIKILREKELLNDCVQASDYSEWKGSRKQEVVDAPEINSAVQELKLAFK